MKPTVSVIVPTYNRASLLPDAVRSILEGTYTPLEVIVADDGSTDETRQVVQSMGARVRYLYQENRGPAAARNLGIRNARGDLLAFLDSDDLWLPQTLEWLLARLATNDAEPVHVVVGLSQRVRLDTLEPMGGVWAARSFGAGLMRREVFDRVGLLDETLRYGEDIDWFLRMREADVPFAYIERVTQLYRIHPHSLMRDTARAKFYTLQAIRKSIARRTNPQTGEVTPLPEMPDLDELLKIVSGGTP